VRQVLPEPGEVDLASAYAVARPAPPGRPWAVALMASSADGAAAVDGVSGALGGDGDRLVFRAVRATADAVVVGAGTVRDERYGPVRTHPDHAAARSARGQAAHPRLVVVSGRLDLDPAARLFAEADGTTLPPLVAHPPSSPPEARRRLAEVAELLEVPASPGGGVDPAALWAELGHRGVRVAVVEGGPTLNGALLAADVLDELCLTLDPMVVGGASPRIAHRDGPATPRRWQPAHLLEHDGVLFWRLVRDRG
jgi:riboflavin biosynthesis pyrimidine reductase